ncbi:hypothetical protein DFH08DRAFT_1081213 [Mycena albidolilacea]|uniref:Uncharacterized protein n=1 Tax=Mycena albidolilacea TaxID=1033008 RepID=A0AAD6ZXV1_9AGAR|nr:hypothetical protein DFH08DRAFT_1081213 [Mycena albidolilacea]
MELKSDTYSQENGPGSESVTPSGHRTSRIVWPVYIIAGQLVLLSLALGFLAAVRGRGQIPLGPELAELFQDNPQSKTYLVTFLATALSTFSSFLFSQAVRHAIVISLTRPVPLSTLGFGILISRRSLVLVNREYKWGFISAVLFFATLAQTAGWTSLLTPINISVLVPLKGAEIDVSSPSFQAQFPQLWTNTIENTIDSELQSTITASGAASATNQSGYPAILDFGGWAHNISTRGIFPVQLQNFTEASNVNDTTQLITSNTAPFSSIPPANYAMNQQGLTAQVSCQSAVLDETSKPQLSRKAVPVLGDSGFLRWNIATDCPGNYSSGGTISFPGFNNTLFLLGCASDDDFGQTTYTAIIDGQGLYTGTYICTITPQIQNMIANYTNPFISTNFDDSSPAKNAGAIGFVGFYAVYSAFVYGQSTSHNSIGDSILAIFKDQDNTTFLEILEAYITGIVEFSGTAIKTRLSVANGPFNGNPPPVMTRAITGTATVNTLGWHHKSVTSGLVLIPAVFVALVSIGITLVAQYYNRGIPINHADFDPNNPWRLMAAASAGGMTRVFGGLDVEHVEEGLEKKVVLGQVGGRDGFVYV